MNFKVYYQSMLRKRLFFIQEKILIIHQNNSKNSKMRTLVKIVLLLLKIFNFYQKKMISLQNYSKMKLLKKKITMYIFYLLLIWKHSNYLIKTKVLIQFFHFIVQRLWIIYYNLLKLLKGKFYLNIVIGEHLLIIQK